MRAAEVWNTTLGQGMTHRLMKWILPDLVWNQRIYGNVVQKYVNEIGRAHV